MALPREQLSLEEFLRVPEEELDLGDVIPGLKLRASDVFGVLKLR